MTPMLKPKEDIINTFFVIVRRMLNRDAADLQ